jgi:hypothetical protein
VRGRLVLLAPVILCWAALAGCGGDDGNEESREAVADYIRAANTTQQRFAVVYAEADEALREFGQKGAMGKRTSDELGDAVAAMRDVRASLADLEPPAEARKLHAELLQLLDLQTGLTRDLSELARYLPNAADALRSAEVARTKLQKTLEASDTVPAQAAAARAYGKAVDRSVEDLREVNPPGMLSAWHEGQVDLLRTSAQLGNGLAAGLESGNRAQIERVLRRFQSASRDAAAVARAQLLAVRSFNDRVKKQRALVRRIVQEQRRLDRAIA